MDHGSSDPKHRIVILMTKTSSQLFYNTNILKHFLVLLTKLNVNSIPYVKNTKISVFQLFPIYAKPFGICYFY